jgi:hypothetical protein
MSKRILLQIVQAALLASLLFSLKLNSTVLATQSVFGIGITPAQAHPSFQGNEGQAQAFILLTSPDPQQLAQVKNLVESNGGRVIHTFPYQAIIVKVKAGVIQQLNTWSGVAMVLTQPVELSQVDIYGPHARRLVSTWNNLFALSAETAVSSLTTAEYPAELSDAFIAPDLPQIGTLSVDSSSITPGYYQTSEFMAGSIAVGVVLVESDGSVDPSSEDWTADEKQLVFSEIVAALNWWAKLEPRANLSFVYDDHLTQPLPTAVEPITRPYTHQHYWISDAMNALGYDNSTSYYTLIRDYNNAIRSRYQTDWAFTIFVVDSSADLDNRFSDGFFAYAYLGGPFTVLTYGNNGYGPGNLDAVVAHEVGHIFHALDQYFGSEPCDSRSGYLYLENQNSQIQNGSCTSNEASIMRGSTYPYAISAIDVYAAGQIGWRDSDGDNILDPLDSDLPVRIDTLTQEGNVVEVSGAAEIVPYPTANYRMSSATINTLTGVRYRFNGGPWQQALAADGAFDSTNETYYFMTQPLFPGLHNLEVAAVDSAGNVSEVYATETIIIFDTIDNGLNTVLLPPSDGLAGQATTLEGVAYNLPGNVVSKVEYRINGGSWHSAIAQDGNFDSDYEPFAITLEPLEAGTHLFEAFATDAYGYQETDIARQEIAFSDRSISTVFLPIVIRDMQ